MKYDSDLIQKMNLFEKITGARLKDAFYFKNRLVFVVQEGELSKALGRNKERVKKVQRLFKEKVKVVEYSPEKVKFIVNFLNPLRIRSAEEKDGVVILKGEDRSVNALIIGSKAQNLRELERVVKNYFDLKEIKVV